MTPYYEHAGITIYHADCRDVLPQLPKVDLVVTSPPYDNLRVYGGHSWNFEATADGIWAAAADGCVVVWIVNDETVDGDKTGSAFAQVLYFKRLGFRFHDTMIWNKGGFTDVIAADLSRG